MTKDITLSCRQALWSAAVHCSIAQPPCRSKTPTHPFVWKAHCCLRYSTCSEDAPARPESVDDHASAVIEAAHLPAAGNTRTETAPCSTLRRGSRRTMRRDAGRLATADSRRAYFPCGCCIRRPPDAETPSMCPDIQAQKTTALRGWAPLSVELLRSVQECATDACGQSRRRPGILALHGSSMACLKSLCHELHKFRISGKQRELISQSGRR